MLSTLAIISAHILLFQPAPLVYAIPLHLTLPTLINSDVLNSTTLPLINAIPLHEYPCFDSRPDRLPAKYNDCEEAIIKMHRMSDMRRYTFGRGSRVTYKLPRSFSSGTCMISLDMVYDDQTDALTFDKIRMAASTLALRCTTGPLFRFGGAVSVGPRDVLYITILGTAPSTI